MRLNKFISSCGLSSRRRADDLIASGMVRVNGEIIRTVGVSVDPDRDTVTVRGHACVPRENFTYLVLHKPLGYVCTNRRFRSEKSIFQLLPRVYQHLKIAGRLDKDSAGLVVLTDDGELINTMTHPKFQHEKEYAVTLDQPLGKGELAALRRGVRLTEGLAKADMIVPVLGVTYRIVLHQGWNRQVRRMFNGVRRSVVALKRIREGNLSLGILSPGKFRLISRDDLIRKN
ncbi:MAG: pseudouridine synthase [Patescibacteria group bacterium]